MNPPPSGGSRRRDPFFLAICLFGVVIAELSEQGAFAGVQISRLTALAEKGAPGFEWSLLGPLFGGLAAYFAGRHLGLLAGGISFAAGSALLLAAPSSLFGLGLFTLGHGLLVTCLLALAAIWLPNERGNARVSLFFLVAIGSQSLLLLMPGAAGAGQGAGFLIAAFAVLALMCAAGLAALDFWAGRGADPPLRQEKAPRRPQAEALGLLVGTGILCYAALACAYQQQQQALAAWQQQGHQLDWLFTMTGVLTIALMVVGILLGLMGTFMGLPRLGVSAVIPFALMMAAVAVLCGSLLLREGEPLVAFSLFSAMATGFLQMAMVPLLAAVAGGVGPRFAPLAIGIHLGLGGPIFGRLIGESLNGFGNAAVYPFAFLLIAAAVAGHFLGRRADASLELAVPVSVSDRSG